MTYWVAQIDSTDKRVIERLTELGLEPWKVPGFSYALLRCPVAPALSPLSAEGFVRLLPTSINPRPLPDDAAEAFMATCRAANANRQAIRDSKVAEALEPVIAGMERNLLANLLRRSGFAVSIGNDRVELDDHPPRSGRRNHGHDARRAAQASVR